MKAKYIIAGIGIAIAGAALYSMDFVRRTRAVFERMQIYVTGVKNVTFTSASEIKLNLSFILQNPTQEGFTVTGANMARLKSLTVFYKGKYLGAATLNLAEIEIKPYESIEIKDIPFSISTQNVLETVLESNLNTDFLTLRSVVVVLGREYSIDNQLAA